MSPLQIAYLFVGLLYSSHFAWYVWSEEADRPRNNLERAVFGILYIYSFLAWPHCLVMDLITSVQYYRKKYQK